MSFCKFSPSYQMGNKVMVDNEFILNFLPSAPDLCVKAYLLGLSKCSCADDDENSMDFFVRTLNVCEDDVVSLFKYWEDKGLVQVLSKDPIEIRYLPINSAAGNVKKFKVDKYTDFNIQVQELFEGRMVMPNEFVEFYNLIEKHHIAENALLAIIKYCVEFKGFNLSPSYVVAVAKDWERFGIRTLEQVEEKIQELGVVDDRIKLLFTALGTSRKPQLEDKELLNKWLNAYGFELNVIIYIIKSLKTKKKKLDIFALDSVLTKYYEIKVMSIQEIENYENEKEHLYQVAMTINKELGVFYEDLSKEIDTYVVQWINMGFDLETLKMIADNCFKSSIRTLEGFNNIINKLFKLGIVNLNSYLQYLSDNLVQDEQIKEILIGLNMSRNVNNVDRGFYRVWTQDWNFDKDVILHAVSLSKDKSNAMQYLNKILSNWNAQGIKTIDKAKNVKVESAEESTFIHNNYTKEQIASLITNLDEVEV